MLLVLGTSLKAATAGNIVADFPGHRILVTLDSGQVSVLFTVVTDQDKTLPHRRQPAAKDVNGDDALDVCFVGDVQVSMCIYCDASV